MVETWQLLQSGVCASAWNMAWDEALLESAVTRSDPVVRFYGWREAAATFGYSQRFADVSRWTTLRPLIRRPTGGGLVLHDSDWTYSVVIPPSHSWYQLRAAESYQRMHEWIRDAFARMNLVTELSPGCHKDIPGQCFAGAEKFDVLRAGRKIAGAAQRRNKDGLLIQGSVRVEPSQADRRSWEKAMCDAVPASMPVTWQNFEPDQSLLEHVRRLTTGKYERREFNESR
ncbi:MAG: hypothetical protein EXS31_03185 [Pedosphaera sp.]|nr:hypothetical protein [Pedosphaera sp.]